MKTNIKFKNSVFTMLFNDPDLLRELYSALEGVELPPDTPVFINTLEDVLFMNFINDISFEIGGKLVVLIEHQSTINENMPLRLLMYIARIYEKLIKGKNIFAKNPLKIPYPEFFVLYNGTDPYPDSEVYRLSDSFEDPSALGLKKESCRTLELVVRVININEGRNKEIAERCKKLSEYSAFVAKARAFKKEHGSQEKALKEVVKYCQKHGILKEFLELHGTEVLNMLYTEFNLDDALAMRYEEGIEEGLEKGREEGLEDGLVMGLEKGREDKQLEIARSALAEGATFEFVQKITGLDFETIRNLGN